VTNLRFRLARSLSVQITDFFPLHFLVPSSTHLEIKEARRRIRKLGRAVLVGIKPIWAPGVLIQVLRKLAPDGFTWVEFSLKKRTENKTPTEYIEDFTHKPLR
jgi:hypothetical protein